jgi:hypothetical protein
MLMTDETPADAPPCSPSPMPTQEIPVWTPGRAANYAVASFLALFEFRTPAPKNPSRRLI